MCGGSFLLLLQSEGGKSSTPPNIFLVSTSFISHTHTHFRRNKLKTALGMKKLLLFLLIGALLLVDADAQQKSRKKKVRHERKKEAAEEIPSTPAEATLQKLDVDEFVKQERARIALQEKLDNMRENENEAENDVETSPQEEYPDPCGDKRCGPGRECIPGEKGRARCVCLSKCPSEEDMRRKVCSNYNETWNSDCELYRSRCLCDENSDECVDQLNKHLHIEYYGECRQMPACTEEEMSDFPRRMRDWLFNVMRELAERRELSPHYLAMEREAERSTKEGHRAGVASVWKWCDLDGHPHDRVVSRHELFPIRAPLMALEHCIAPFLDSCDADADHRITLKEWGTCLEVPDEELEVKCDEIRDGLPQEEGDEEV